MKGYRSVSADNREKAKDAPSAEWRITMLFYAAVHAVNYKKFGGGVAPTTFEHGQRREYVGTTLAAIRQAYKQLEDLSVAARYLAERHPLGKEQVQRAERLADEVLRACGI